MKTVQLGEKHVSYLAILLAAEIKSSKDQMKHAHSHGDVGYIDPDLATATEILEAISNPE